MLTLAIDSSSKSASAALVRDGNLIAECYLRNGLTHSRTLMPLVADCLKSADLTLDDVDRIAVTNGPGSFTGLRIGVAAVKGMAWAKNIACVGVSTLAAAAYNGVNTGLMTCALMDARAGQVYTATFSTDGGVLTRLTPDRAVNIDELAGSLKGEKVFLVGDGAAIYCERLRQNGVDAVLAPDPMRYVHGFGVAALADSAPAVTGAELKVNYLRPSQAERERDAKKATQ